MVRILRLSAQDDKEAVERARVAESLGSVDVAREYYRRFLVRYDAPTPLHRHLVAEANQALSRLATADRLRQ